MRPRRSRSPSPAPMRSTSRALRFRPPAASWRLKLFGVRAPRAATSTRRLPAFRWRISDASQLSEFYGSGRQSRIALKAVGKLPNMTLTGYYEMDWLSAGVTSNSNQSNSYTLRQRQLWADALLSNGWDFSAAARAGRWQPKPLRVLPEEREILPCIHRCTVRRRLCVDAPIQLPRLQEHRQEVLPRRIGGECRDAQPSRTESADQLSVRLSWNGRRTLQPECQLLLQLCSGHHRQGGL